MALFQLGTRYVLDETVGLQNGTGGDADVLFSTLPATFRAYLDTLGQSYSFATSNGAAHSTSNVIQITGTTSVSALVLVDANNQALNGDDSGILTLAGNHVFLYATSDPHIVIGREGSGSTANPSGDVVFAVYLDAAANNLSASLWTVQFEPIHNPDPNSPDDVVDLGNSLHIGAAGDFALDFGTLASGQLLYGSFGDASLAVIVAGRDQSTTDGDGIDTINTSQGGGGITIGVNNQMFDPGRIVQGQFIPGDAAYFTFVEGLQPASGTTMPSSGANAPGGVSAIDYTALHSSIGASFSIVQIQGGGANARTNVQLHAYNTAMEEGTAFLPGQGDADDVEVRIDTATVQVFLAGVQVTQGITVVQLTGGLGVDVRGIPAGATVRYATVDAAGMPTTHSRLMIENFDGNPFDVGGFALQGPPTYASIGQLIGFGDDGPAAGLSLTGISAVTDESTVPNSDDGGLALPNDESGHVVSLANGSRLIGWDQASVVSITSTAAGTDGGSSHVTLSLGANTDSGLTTTDGTAITLSLEGGVVVGRAGAEAIFAVAIDDSGQVTVEQYDSIRHSPAPGFDTLAAIAAGRIFASVTVTDGDSDTATQSVDIGGAIGFEDDGPSATLTLIAASLIVDESVGADLADPNAADELGQGVDVIGWAQLSGTGLFTTTRDYGEDEEGATSVFSLRIQNAATMLRISNTNSLIGLVQDGNQAVIGRSADGQDVFRIEIDQSDGRVTMIQYRAIEHNNTASTDELSEQLGSGLLYAVWTVTDGDGDAVAPQVDLGSIISIEDDGPSLNPTSFDDLTIGNSPGTVSDNVVVFDPGSDSASAWSITDAPGSQGSGSSGFAWRYYDSTGDGVADTNSVVGTLDGVDLYRMFIDSDGTYDFTLLRALTGVDLRLDTSDIKAGGPDTYFIDVGALSSPNFVRISGFIDPDGPGGAPRVGAAVNESRGNVGVVNGNLDEGETLTFSLFAPDGSDADTLPDIQDISGITIGTKTPKTTHYSYTAYNDGVAVAGMTNVVVEVGKNGAIVINAPPGVFFDTIELTSLDGSAVKIGLGDISIRILPPDLSLGFIFQLSDGDSDPTSTGVVVGIDGNGDGAVNAATTSFSEPLTGGGLGMLGMVKELEAYDPMQHSQLTQLF